MFLAASAGRGAFPCIAGHGNAGVGGVFVDDLVAVSEGVGDQGGWQFLDEAAEGGVPGAAEVDAQGAELVHHGVGVDVLSGHGSGEEPLVGAVAGLLVGPLVQVFPEHGGDLGRNQNRDVSQAQVQPVGQGLEVRTFQGGDLADGLAEEQQDQGSDPERQGCFVGLDAAADEFDASLLGDQGLRGRRSGAACRAWRSPCS